MATPGTDPLFQEILLARRFVYRLAQPTPLQALSIPGLRGEVWCKREDLSPIHAYKWRGAFNRMAQLEPAEQRRGVVTASAGNHAQGVALAARRLGMRAEIFMPRSTPLMKQQAVAKHGGDAVTVHLTGDTYDQAHAAARTAGETRGALFIPAFDDLKVMGGQGTLADEIVMSGEGPFARAYLQIGGGGMAGAVACWLKAYYPEIEVVGVEGEGQASMQAARAAGCPVTLDQVDVFCDGTAVRRVGDLSFAACQRYVDRLITVSNDAVASAVQTLWETARCIPEPSGAMGLAGLLKEQQSLPEGRCLTVLCGANMDFPQLAGLARSAAIGARRRRFYRLDLPERAGALLAVVDRLPEQANIVDFQYGKTDSTKAWPVIGVEGDEAALTAVERVLREATAGWQDVTREETILYRLIHYRSELMDHPILLHVDFHERPGALVGFLRHLVGSANLCYFNYSYSGERVGRALVGFELGPDLTREAFLAQVREAGASFRDARPVDPAMARRFFA
ncbi:MAG: pyridoxal-phosphate dependent enzyme [Opitutales bacterium]